MSDGAVLPDELLLQICRVSSIGRDEEPDWLTDLRTIPWLLGICDEPLHLELGVTALAAVLGVLPRHHPAQVPTGVVGMDVQLVQWIHHEALDRTAKQIAGLLGSDRHPDEVASSIEDAVEQAIRLGFLEAKRYDTWRPTMISGTGWCCALMATPYGMTRARQLMPKPVSVTTEASSSAIEDRHGLTSVARPPDATVVEDAATTRSSVAATIACSYTWARQIDLVNATNQVLGDGTLNKTAVSRACRAQRIQTNGRPGRALRVAVASFLVWLDRRCSLAHDEQLQVRNAIVGEISTRNTRMWR